MKAANPMRPAILTTAVALCITCGVAAAQRSNSSAPVDTKKIETTVRSAIHKDDSGAWRKIDWQPNMESTLKKSQADGKPILAFIVVGNLGEQNAPEC